MKTIGRLLNMAANPAAMNMAVDEAMLLSQKEQPNPTLRFYTWSSPAFSFGYFQDIASEVDVEMCRADGIELVKRMTGGGTVVHGWDLTYTLILHATPVKRAFPKRIDASDRASSWHSKARYPRGVSRCRHRCLQYGYKPHLQGRG